MSAQQGFLVLALALALGTAASLHGLLIDALHLDNRLVWVAALIGPGLAAASWAHSMLKERGAKRKAR